MIDDRPKRDTMSLEEATISNMWEMAAIVPPRLVDNQICPYTAMYMWPTTPADVAQWIAAAFNRRLTVESDHTDTHVGNNKFSERRP